MGWGPEDVGAAVAAAMAVGGEDLGALPTPRFSRAPIMAKYANRTLRIGTVGWEHAAWQDSFYPDDLPPEWRLAYYANEFLTVLVPAARWMGLAAAEAQRWSEDLPARFRLFLQAPPVAQPLKATAVEGLESLGSQVAGIVFPMMPSAALRDQIRARVGGAALLVGSTSEAVTVLAEAPTDLPTLRRLIEPFAGHGPEPSQAYLFFGGSPPAVQAVRDAVTIAGLFGLG